jgi:hypothetical protein
VKKHEPENDRVLVRTVPSTARDLISKAQVAAAIEYGEKVAIVGCIELKPNQNKHDGIGFRIIGGNFEFSLSIHAAEYLVCALNAWIDGFEV